ncbi:MAG: recombinase family protein, partial [Rhodospirillaceae bacterium]
DVERVMCKFVAYYRTSTSKQSLSFDAQKEAVNAYIRDGELIAEFTEVETGKNNDRPKLKEAIALSKKTKSILIIAKLDRLSRNLAFIANILDGNIDFVCADMPNANKMMLQMMAVIAEFEAKQISERTIAALQAAKARGILLGNRTNWKEAQALGQEMNIKLATEHADKIIPIIRDLSRRDAGSLHRIADELNARNIPTRRNAVWTGTAVRHIIRRAGFESLRELA